MTPAGEASPRERWGAGRLPVFFQAGGEPRSHRPLPVAGATAGGFALRVVLGAGAFAVPAGLLLAVAMIGEALVPLIIGAAIDQALATGDAGRLVWWLLVLAADFLVLSFALRFGSRMGLYGMQRVQHRLRTQVVERLLHPAGLLHGHADGAALSIATSDVHRLAATVQLAVYPVGEVAALAFAAAALFWISWPLGAATAVGAVILVVVMFLSGGRLRRRSEEEQALGADAVDRVADLLAGYRVLKGLRAEAEASARYRAASRAALAGTLRAKRAQGVFLGGMDAASGLFTAGLTVLAGLLALDGRLGVGELVAAAGLIQYLVGPLTALPANVGAVWAVSTASAARVLTVLQAPLRHASEVASGAEEEDRGYPGSGVEPEPEPEPETEPVAEPALEIEVPGLRLRVEPGECVGIVAGQSGSGRLVRLLAATPRADDIGAIRLGGRAAAATGIERWRRTLLVSPHRAELFDGSVAQNLEVPGGAPERVAPALHAAACDDVLEAIPGGLGAPVGEGGTRLSGGQRQRIALARAYAAQPEVLVLHDPTTAVDASTEQLIAARLRDVRERCTTLVIASSPALLAVCDRVVVLPEMEAENAEGRAA